MFVNNATSGVAAVVRSVLATLNPGDSIIAFSVVYGKVQSNLL